MSLVERLRKRLEAGGEYVTRAKIGWFAIFPEKLVRLEQQAVRDGREGPNLIVYRSDRGNDRDHFVIPHALLRTLAVPETLSATGTTGERRWNFTLKGDALRVTHRAGEVDVSPYRGALLLVEDLDRLVQATADVDEFEMRVRLLASRPLARPLGSPAPRQVEGVVGRVFERRPDVKAWVLRASAGVCELCRSPAPFVTGDGQPFLELHHVHRLADGGPDTVENAVAVCPNCHRMLHHGVDRGARREALYEQVTRLRPSTA